MQNRCCSQRCQPAECFAAIHHDLISVLPQPTNELKPSCASGYISIAENGNIWIHTSIQNRSCLLQVVNGGRPTEYFAVICCELSSVLPNC